MQQYCDGYGVCYATAPKYTLHLRRIVAIPRQRLGKQLLSLQRMLTKVIPVTSWTTDEKLPFDKVFSIRGANTLFQGGKE
jgi:hypothetical protein